MPAVTTTTAPGTVARQRVCGTALCAGGTSGVVYFHLRAVARPGRSVVATVTNQAELTGKATVQTSCCRKCLNDSLETRINGGPGGTWCTLVQNLLQQVVKRLQGEQGRLEGAGLLAPSSNCEVSAGHCAEATGIPLAHPRRKEGINSGC